MLSKEMFEESLLREDVVEYYLSKTKEELLEELGTKVARMKGFEQKNAHHCYDLYEHTIRTVQGINSEGLSPEEFKKLRIAAFFHDIGKPDVSKFNEKTGQQVFYGHAVHSVEVAKPILEKLGYSEDEISQISFYIAHHDDFISYKTKIEPYMRNHQFIREINDKSVAEKIIENQYDFKSMGYDENQIRAIVYTLANGKKPDFRDFKGKPITVNVDMKEVINKINSAKYNMEFVPTQKDYYLLLRVCKADAGAQSEVAIQNGKEVGSKVQKLENMTNIENSILSSFELLNTITKDNNIEDKDKEKIKMEEKGKKIYIVDHTWFSGDQGNNMNTDRIIHGIYTKKEDAIKMFEEVRLKDSNWYGGFQKAAILEGVLDGEYKENDITDLVLKELETKKNGEKNTTEEVIEAEKNVIDITKLGLSIGMEEKEQTLPNGKVVKTLLWDQENLLKAVNAVKHLSEEGKPVRITGPAPAWLVSALTHTVHPCPVGVYMPQIGKDVDIPKLAHGEINPEGEVGFKVIEKGNVVVIEYNMELPEGITTYDENNLSKVVVPEIPQGKEVYISGRGPNYLTVAIAEAYAHTNSSVSLFQPGIGYTCSITHSRAKKLGDLIKDPLGKEKVKEKLTVEKENKLTEQE